MVILLWESNPIAKDHDIYTTRFHSKDTSTSQRLPLSSYLKSNWMGEVLRIGSCSYNTCTCHAIARSLLYLYTKLRVLQASWHKKLKIRTSTTKVSRYTFFY